MSTSPAGPVQIGGRAGLCITGLTLVESSLQRSWTGSESAFVVIETECWDVGVCDGW